MEKLYPYFGLAGRVLLAIMFVVAGYGKIGDYAGTQGYMESMGMPGMLLPPRRRATRPAQAHRSPVHTLGRKWTWTRPDP